MTAAKDAGFLGRGWSFPPAFDRDEGSVEMVSGELDIMQSLHILLTTLLGERLMRPEYGCALQSQVFEVMDTSTAAYLSSVIDDAILFGEPRISVEKIEIDDMESNDGMRRVSIDFTIRKTNTRSNIVFPFYQQEGTNVRLLE